jgi:hypothetical protein
MRRVIVNEWMSLDGVVQAPGAPDEDTSGGFEHGGWHLRYFDDSAQRPLRQRAEALATRRRRSDHHGSDPRHLRSGRELTGQ